MKKINLWKHFLAYSTSAAIAVVSAFGANAAFADVDPSDVPENTGLVSPTFNGLKLKSGDAENTLGSDTWFFSGTPLYTIGQGVTQFRLGGSVVEVLNSLSVTFRTATQSLVITDPEAGSKFGNGVRAANGATVYENLIAGSTRVDGKVDFKEDISISNKKIDGIAGSFIEVDRIEADRLNVDGHFSADTIGSYSISTSGWMDVLAGKQNSQLLSCNNGNQDLISCGYTSEDTSGSLIVTGSYPIFDQNAGYFRCQLNATNKGNSVGRVKQHALCFDPQG